MMNHPVMMRKITLKVYLRGVGMVAIIIGEESRNLGVAEVKTLKDTVVEVNKANT